MKSQGYGRFGFIASSAGLFGQPDSAHYAAAKAGTVGLANVIAIDGAEHGILANCVLSFGYSRMVYELVGERDEIEPEPGFLHAIEPELVVPAVVYLASCDCQLTHHNFSACIRWPGVQSGQLGPAGAVRCRAAGGRGDQLCPPRRQPVTAAESAKTDRGR